MGKVGVLKRGVGNLRHFRRREVFCFIVECMLPRFGVLVSSTLGDDFLNEKEAQLKYIADAVMSNDAQKCALYETCTAPKNCSRNTCWPQTGDVGRLTCMPVSFNKYCHAPGGGPCQDKYFDYTRSFVRAAANTNFESFLTTIGTCTQRALDPPFQNISKPDSLLRVYFGAVDGTWRAFPGSDQSVDDCGGYDTRLRPWYRASTYIPKVVAILIDAGQSMSTILSAGQGQGSILNAFQVIVLELLKTLYVQDYVNIIMFDCAKATPLAPSMVQVEPYQNLSDTTYLPELEPLKQSLLQQKTANQTGTSNVTLAIEAALLGFGTNNYPEAAKIILILTDGKFAKANSSSILTSNLTSANVKLFMYKIPQPNDDELFLGDGSFSNQLCSVGGSFEVLGDDLLNPLLALNSFFTFTAMLHAKVANNSADYSIIYPGYEQIQGNITTVSRPVFGANKTLLGVVGMDIFISSLGNLTDLVLFAIRNRTGGLFNPSNFVLTNGSCSQLQTEQPSPEPCGAVSMPLNGGFCAHTDTTSTIGDLACCKSCAAKQPSRGSDDGDNLGAILGGSVAGVVAVALLGCLFIWWSRKRGPTIPPFKGPVSDEDTPNDSIRYRTTALTE